MKLYTVIAFDVSDDRKRYRLVRALKALATRVQKSVFDAMMEETALLRLRSELEQHVDLKTDCVVYARMCRACAERVVVVGKRCTVEDTKDEWVVI